MRIKSNALVSINGIKFFDDTPFTGSGIYLQEGIVNRCVIYENGVEKEGDNSECFLLTKTSLTVDKDFLSSNGGVEPFHYQELRFNGLALDFDGQYCVGELLIYNGLVEQEVSCFPNGNLGFFEGYHNNIEENIYWYSDGSLKEENIVFCDGIRGNFGFDKKGLLTTAIIQNDYFQMFHKMKKDLLYCDISSIKSFENINASDFIFLSGKGVDSRFLEALADLNGLLGVRRLSLDNCSFALKYYSVIGQLTYLNSLIINDARVGVLDMLKEIKMNRPELSIIFNKNELIIS